ncbi:MAG: hypothetical protein FJ363_12230 [Gemmatimonadetes bacterium]|nr:hypothetical protein [Gemmatimonadota bacterium]
MARVLSMQRTVVPPAEREAFRARATARAAHYAAAGCQYWVFEEIELPGAFVEFTEARDAEMLRAAHASAAEPPLDPARLYAQVDLP